MIPQSPLSKRGMYFGSMTFPLRCQGCGKIIKKTVKTKSHHIAKCQKCRNKGR